MNYYNHEKDYGILTDEKGNICLYDLEDEELLKKYNWFHSRGYWVTIENDKLLNMHTLIMNTPENLTVDHIKHVMNGYTDNRKNNLRICTFKENCQHRSKAKNNTSGIIGVRIKRTKWGNYWRAQIKVNGKMKTLGEYKDKEKAIIKRLEAEKQYFGEFAPQKELFEIYGI